jgi:ribulose-phosphate 3-epimerase
VRLSASVLNADFGHLADQVRQAETAGVDLIHVDVMDGHFVPNISLGFVVVEAIRRATSLPLDVHLMIEQPERYLERFASAGATYLTVHQEAGRHLHRLVAEMKSLGLKAGVALNPATPLIAVEEICAELDLLLIMTINPGFGGQELIPAMLDKVARARAILDRTTSRTTRATWPWPAPRSSWSEPASSAPPAGSPPGSPSFANRYELPGSVPRAA